MTHETCLWLNRLSILFAYMAFWFVAPEFIGQARLVSWQLHAKKLVILMSASWIAMLQILMMLFNLQSTIASVRVTHSFWRGFLRGIKQSPKLTPGQWALLGVVLLFGLALTLWGKRLINVLASQDKWRSVSFVFGAILFTVSCGLQAASTIEKIN